MSRVAALRDAVAHEIVRTARAFAFTAVHRNYPSVCDDLDRVRHPGEDRIECRSCGWVVTFHENDVRVKAQYPDLPPSTPLSAFEEYQ